MRPGDLIIPVIGRQIGVRVAVSEQVGSELEPGIQLLRIDAEQLDPWFVAGALTFHSNHNRSS